MKILGYDIKKSPQAVYVLKPEERKKRGIIIEETAVQRIQPSIDDLLDAIEGATGKGVQYRNTLYDSYISTLRYDPVVVSLMEKREDNIRNKTIEVLYNGEPNEELQYFFSASVFKEFCVDIATTPFWGFSLFEFYREEYDGNPWFSYFRFPNKHVNPYTEEVLRTQFDSGGTSYKTRPNILFSGDADDIGLFSQITLLSTYRRYGLFNWSRYSELAGENFTVHQSRAYLEDDEIRAMQEDIKSRRNPGVSLPVGEDLDIKSLANTSQNQLFEGYMNYIDERLSIFILGQTMTTQDGASRSQAEVHESEQNNKFVADERRVIDELNYNFRDLLPLWFGDRVNPERVEFRFKPNTERELTQQIEVYKALTELGVAWTDAELRTKFADII